MCLGERAAADGDGAGQAGVYLPRLRHRARRNNPLHPLRSALNRCFFHEHPPDTALLSRHSAYSLWRLLESRSRATWLTEGAVRGLQIFYTRTSPSRSFDLLSDDFDYVVLLLMITGLATLTGSFWWWSKNKDLASAWR